MKFNCKKIQIDGDELGYTLMFSEHETDFEKEMNMSPVELMNSTGKYILLQRTYPEDEFDDDFYYFEPSDFDKACALQDFVINLFPTRFELLLSGNLYQVEFHADDQKFEQLKQVLQKITNGKGTLIIHQNGN